MFQLFTKKKQIKMSNIRNIIARILNEEFGGSQKDKLVSILNSLEFKNDVLAAGGEIYAVGGIVRDAIMEKYDRLFPDYHFSKNKGYGTKVHIQALERQGCCSVHRRSFKRVVSKGRN